jgi:hypothetical protein
MDGSMPNALGSDRELTIDEIAALTGAKPRAGDGRDCRIVNIAPLDTAAASGGKVSLPRHEPPASGQGKADDQKARSRTQDKDGRVKKEVIRGSKAQRAEQTLRQASRGRQRVSKR